MGKKFGQDQNQSDCSEGDLHSLPPQAPPRNRFLPPLSRGPLSERSNSPDHVQVDARSEDRKKHHGNANGVLVKSSCGSFGSHGDCSESSQSNGEPHAAKRHDEGAGALQNNEKKAGETDSPTADSLVTRKLMCLRSLRGDHCSLCGHAHLTLRFRQGYRKTYDIRAKAALVTITPFRWSQLQISGPVPFRKTAGRSDFE